MQSRHTNGGRFSGLPPVLEALLIVNVIVFVLQMLSPSYVLEYYLGLNPIGNGLLPWQFVTYQFLHRDFMHILMNMFVLWNFGSIMEQTIGSKRFLSFYLLSGVGAGLAHVAFDYFMGSAHPVIGASGSVMGVVVGFAVLYPNVQIITFPLFYPLKAKYAVFLSAVVFQLVSYNAQASNPGSSDRVAYIAHFGGALFGLIFAFMIKRNLLQNPMNTGAAQSDKNTFRRQTIIEAEHRDVGDNSRAGQNDRPTIHVAYVPETRSKTETKFIVNGNVIYQEDIDAILDKVTKFGYHNLSYDEKHILEEVSKQM